MDEVYSHYETGAHLKRGGGVRADGLAAAAASWARAQTASSRFKQTNKCPFLLIDKHTQALTSGSMRLRGVIQLASMCEGTVAESSWGLAGVYLAVLRGVQ